MSNAEHLIENAIMAIEEHENLKDAWDWFTTYEINIHLSQATGISLEAIWDIACYVVLERKSQKRTNVECFLTKCRYNEECACTKERIVLDEEHCCDGGCDDGWEIREEEPSEDQTGWTSCKDAFPITPDEKLVQRENGSMAIAYYDDPGWSIWNSEERCFHEIGDVIAWRDLPDPFVER